MSRAALSLLALTVIPAVSAQDSDPLAALATETRPLATRWQADYRGALELGGAWVSDNNYMFGQYNGLSDDGGTVIANLGWQDFRSGDAYWQVDMSNLGLDTREGTVTWGLPQRLRVTAGFDSQVQVRNDSGRTPFRGDTALTLPDSWVSGQTTDEFTALQASSRGFDRELERDRLFLEIEANPWDRWQARGALSYEEKQGTGDIGAAIYIDAAAGDAALLPADVDQENLEASAGLAYQGDRFHLDGELGYSEFDNQSDLLTWQNPYNAFGDSVAWPTGTGGLALAPDSEQLYGRLVGTYIFSTTTRLQFDGSYAVNSQDDDFAAYSVNSNLNVSEPVPLNSFDGEVAVGTFSGRLLLRPLRQLDAELYYKLRDRDYDTPRDGYQYIRGDGDDQPQSAFTVYNTANDLTQQTVGAEATWRTREYGRIGFEYAYEKVERRNAAVEETEEDRYTLSYRVRPLDTLHARLQFMFADRAADTYQWDQYYFALLDTQLINATPDTQRYTNHPQLFQYYLANRERYESKANVTYLPAAHWTVNLDLTWQYDDYDKSDLGLTESEWIRSHVSFTYSAATDWSASAYLGYDRYDGNQRSRSFRGGQEKNAFAIYPPLPQASDPQQDWELDATDHAVTLGATVTWLATPDIEFEVDYNYVDTRSEQELYTRPGASTQASDLPDVDTTRHQLRASGLWHWRENVSLRLDYQYFTFESDDWAWQDVEADTIDKVLTFGQDNPDEDIHYMGLSVIYRWQ